MMVTSYGDKVHIIRKQKFCAGVLNRKKNQIVYTKYTW